LIEKIGFIALAEQFDVVMDYPLLREKSPQMSDTSMEQWRGHFVIEV